MKRRERRTFKCNADDEIKEVVFKIGKNAKLEKASLVFNRNINDSAHGPQIAFSEKSLGTSVAAKCDTAGVQLWDHLYYKLVTSGSYITWKRKTWDLHNIPLPEGILYVQILNSTGGDARYALTLEYESEF